LECGAGLEIVEGEVEFDGFVGSDEVLQQKKVDVPFEGFEQAEEVGITRENSAERTGGNASHFTGFGRELVMSTDAFEGEVETIVDHGRHASSAVDGWFHVDAVVGKQRVGTDGQAQIE